jgi:hypothetical protein
VTVVLQKISLRQNPNSTPKEKAAFLLLSQYNKERDQKSIQDGSEKFLFALVAKK